MKNVKSIISRLEINLFHTPFFLVVIIPPLNNFKIQKLVQTLFLSGNICHCEALETFFTTFP